MKLKTLLGLLLVSGFTAEAIYVFVHAREGRSFWDGVLFMLLLRPLDASISAFFDAARRDAHHYFGRHP